MNQWKDLFSAHLDTDEIIDNPDQIAPFLCDERGRLQGDSALMLIPKSVESVQMILRLCNEHKIPLTTQGGNTGLCGGATPFGSVLMRLGRLNRVRAINADDMSITVEAGVILQTIQELSAQKGFLFPLSLASEGSCQIGGNLACNAGGINVVRYGTARDLVLGLEVVLPDGSLISQLSPLHKNTAGLDLKQLFIGSEGILGVITAATLKLFMPSGSVASFWAGFKSLQECVCLLKTVRQSGGAVKSFEMISDISLNLVCDDLSLAPPIDPAEFPWQVLCEVEFDSAVSAEHLPEFLFERGFEEIVLANSESQRKTFWKLRETIPVAQKKFGFSINYDIALPIEHVSEFVSRCDAQLRSIFRDTHIVLFGHLGDGSLHYNVFLMEHQGRQIYDFEAQINAIVYGWVVQLNGTVAAEHGIGFIKRHHLSDSRSEVEIKLMRGIKKLIDPNNIMNPNKVLPD